MSWSDSMQQVFGPHSLDDRAPPAAPREILGKRRGFIRMWKVRHGAQIVSVRGFERSAKPSVATARQLLTTGSFLLLIVERGRAVVELCDKPIAVSKGDGILITALEPFRFVTQGMFAGMWIELPFWWLLELCRGEMAGARSRLDGRRAVVVALRAVAALCFADQWAEDESKDILDVLGDLLTRILRAAAHDTPLKGRLIYRIHHFIARNYRNEGVSPKQAAAALGCSLSSIHKCCAAMGMTFGGMLNEMRLSVAAYRLSRERRNVSEIAFECGFSSLSHFCRRYKSRYGVTAGTVQRRHAPEGRGIPA